ncbi:hypothetical protein, partial [Pseudomonas aeruginosa]|uniref:hypothetical protein n=1 Tax=Pseudomonas aeruginosa TaxID=287 RepID=UPI000D43F1A4
ATDRFGGQTSHQGVQADLAEAAVVQREKGDRFIFPTLILTSVYISHSHCIPLPILPTLNHVKRIVQ